MCNTIEVLHNQHPERIRLSGIDCPEKGQAYGQKAKQASSELVFGKEVTLPTFGKIATDASLLMCFCLMELTSITRSSKKAGVGGIGSMRRGM
jgi:endonuclease YncB( thermonuclease family)